MAPYLSVFWEFVWPAAVSVTDILVVAFLIYQVVVIVRGTRAHHVLLGVGVLAVVYLASDRLGLTALHFLLSQLAPAAAFALIVLFHSEFRRALGRLGRYRFGSERFRQIETAEEIVSALEVLARQRKGALVVLEKETGLRTFIESGVRLDAQLTHDLLMALFSRDSKLHDGAVICQRDRVAAAACFVPLSLNPAVTGGLGSRHRAAIGITEESDCLALVVSEETGKVSAAAYGLLRSDIPLKELTAVIGSHFDRREAVAPKAGREEAVRA